MKNFKGCDSALQTYQKCKMYTAKCKLSGEYDKGCHQIPLRGIQNNSLKCKTQALASVYPQIPS